MSEIGPIEQRLRGRYRLSLSEYAEITGEHVTAVRSRAARDALEVPLHQPGGPRRKRYVLSRDVLEANRV